MKGNRHLKILSLIVERPIETQEELAAELINCGFHVTQATVSRDIKELKLAKIQDGDRYRYTIVNNDNHDISVPKYKNIIKETVISVDFAGNLVVVRCHNGMGNAACVAIESMKYEGLVGTIAGDDTIFIAMRNQESAIQYADEIRNYI